MNIGLHSLDCRQNLQMAVGREISARDTNRKTLRRETGNQA